MPRLYLMRHADAGLPPDGGEDRERQLTAAGREAAARMGGWLAERLAAEGRVIGHLWISGVARTVETLECMAPSLGAHPPAVSELMIYDATARALLGVINRTPADVETALLIGHNPALEGLLAGLTDAPLRAYPTGGIAELDTTATWPALGPGDAQLKRFGAPHQLD